jgi:spoIIIJ-associated protein
MSQATTLEARVQQLVSELVDKLGLELRVATEREEDGLRVNLSGGDAEPLLRRKGEALDAMQHVLNSVFQHGLSNHERLVVDCEGFRKAKDREIQQIARFLMEKVRSTGVPQEIGPLNSYARRLVHLEVAAAPDLASESQGDGAVKTVIISRRGGSAR